MRPRGSPPVPSAMSSPSDPVGMTGTSGRRLPVAEPHDRPLAELLLDLPQHRADRLVLRPSLSLSLSLWLSFWFSMAFTFSFDENQPNPHL